METLTSSALKAIVVSPPRATSFSTRSDIVVAGSPADRDVVRRFPPLSQKRMIAFLPIYASRFSSSDLQMNFHDEQFEAAQGRVMATVHVRFQLQRQCLFGEQFYLVGDSPMLGCWDPRIAVPLEWSEGHVWTVDMDIPIDETIQYKFILKGESSKDVVWQPGSDRILSTWKSNNKIVVHEDWHDSLLQKVMEEEPVYVKKVMEEEPVYVHQISSVGSSDNLLFEDEMTLPNAMNTMPTMPMPMPMHTSTTIMEEKKKDESNLNSFRKRFSMHEGGSFESNRVAAPAVNTEDADNGSHEETETEPSFVVKNSSSSYGPDLVDEYKVVPEVKA